MLYGGAVHQGYFLQCVASLYLIVDLACLLAERTLLDDALVGLENRRPVALGTADAEIGLVEVQPASADRVGLEVQYPFRIEGFVLDPHFKVQVRTRRASGAAAQTYDVASLYHLQWFDKNLGQVPVDGLQTILVPQHN